MFKIIAVILLTIMFIFQLIINVFKNKSRYRPIPDELKDVYDNETYLRWKNYFTEKIILNIVFSSIGYVITLSLLLVDVFSYINKGIGNVYTSAIAVIAIYFGIETIIGFIEGLINNLKIEQKYGFNKATTGTLVADAIKELIISSGLLIGITCLISIVLM